jgi:hypothetical protein
LTPRQRSGPRCQRQLTALQCRGRFAHAAAFARVAVPPADAPALSAVRVGDPSGLGQRHASCIAATRSGPSRTASPSMSIVRRGEERGCGCRRHRGRLERGVWQQWRPRCCSCVAVPQSAR